MGLPLYIAPVESDVQGKSGPKSPAHARSAIRRLRLRHRGNGLAREQQRRALAAAALGTQLGPDYTIPPSQDPNASESVSLPLSQQERARLRLREMIGSRMGTMEALDDRVVELFGERWASLHARSNPSPLLDTEGDVRAPAISTRQQPDGPIEFTVDQWDGPENHAELQEPSSRRSLRHTPRSPPPLRRVRSPEYLTLDRDNTSAWDQDRIRRHPRFVERMQSAHRGLPRRTSRYSRTRFDGLGDRDRSLSPEGDGVWDTLLTTLTPDPQPPSLGSSFASTSASAAASQSAATGSSNTSFTAPDAAEETLLEPQSGCENSETEGEDEDDLEQNTLTGFPPGLRSIRSYANVAAQSSGNNDDTYEVLGGIGGMQRIVRNLARREDIPDEWWAEAGLSRTLSRDGTD